MFFIKVQKYKGFDFENITSVNTFDNDMKSSLISMKKDLRI